MPILDFNMAQSCCYYLEGMLTTENVGNKDANSFEIYFVLACVWACGSAMSITSGVDVRKEFSKWWKDTWKTVKFPHRGEVWDYYVDKKKQEFVPWAESVQTIAYDSAVAMSMVTVPTGETASINYWVDNLLARSHGAMLLGSAGVGKTAIIMGKLRAMPEEYTFSVINVNYYTNFLSLMKQLEGPLEKKAGKNFGPPGNKKLIYFVDDLNMAALDKYNTATNISLMRQHMGYGHIYDLNKLTQKILMNTQYLAAMNPTAGSFVINPRLQRLFAAFAIGFPSADSLNTIYSTFLGGHLKSFSSEVVDNGKKVVQAALMLHKSVAGTFRKVRLFFHPLYSHDVSRPARPLRAAHTTPPLLVPERRTWGTRACLALCRPPAPFPSPTVPHSACARPAPHLSQDRLQLPLRVQHPAHGGRLPGHADGQAGADPRPDAAGAAVDARERARLLRPAGRPLRPEKVQGACAQPGQEVLQGALADDAHGGAAHLLPLCAGHRREDIRPHHDLCRAELAPHGRARRVQ